MKDSRGDLEQLLGGITPEAVQAVNAVYGFDLAGDGGGRFTLDVRPAATQRLLDGLPIDHRLQSEVTILCKAEHFHAIVQGSMAADTAFMFGRLKVIGSMGIALKLANLF